MNNKLLLINIITLLFRERQIVDLESDTILINNVLNSINIRDTSLTLDKESRMLNDLKSFAREMMNADSEYVYSLAEVIQRVQIICEYDVPLFEAFRDNILIDLEEHEIKDVIGRIRIGFKRYFKDKAAKDIISKYAYLAKFKPEEIKDIGKFITDLNTDLEPYRTYNEEIDKAVVAEIDFSKKEEVSLQVDKLVAEKTGATVFKSGWQAINKMTDGGFRAGQFTVISALPYNNKSGFSLALLKHFCLYNTPELINPNKKPLILHISFENEINYNLEFLYKSLKENEENVLIDRKAILDTASDEIAQYVIDKLQATGFTVRMLRVNPSDWTYRDIFNKITLLEDEGYEVKACICDYLAMIPTTHCIQGPHGVDIRDLFRRVRNFMSARKICFITPHQISTDGKLLLRNSVLDFVKKIAMGGYYAGSKQLDQEVDLELYLHIERIDGKSYQTIQRGKHRGVDNLPEKDKYCILPFSEVGGIRDDINGKDISVSRIGAYTNSEGVEESPFWMVG